MTDRHTSFSQWLDALPKEARYEYNDIGQGFGKDEATMMRMAWDAAVIQEREACARTAEDVEEKPWFGYENPNTFQDGKWSAANAIRARGNQK